MSMCPTSVGDYATVHLDTAVKVLNHVLVAMVVLDTFLFVSSWGVSYVPVTGFNTMLISFLLCAQSVCVWLIVNNNRISALSFLSPTEFMVGVALGITIGGTILSYVLCSSYRHIEACDHQETNESLVNYMCKEHKGSTVWFWSGLVFWLNLCSSLLLAMGRRELTHYSYYDNIGGGPSMDDYEGHFPTPVSFAGDYASVPEIRQIDHTTPQHLGDEKAKINSV